jgi:hypothetical protein
MTEPAFATGQRVRLSALGLERCPRMQGYFGRVTGRGSGSSYHVLFDGLKTTRQLHHTYLDPDDIVCVEGIGIKAKSK